MNISRCSRTALGLVVIENYKFGLGMIQTQVLSQYNKEDCCLQSVQRRFVIIHRFSHSAARLLCQCDCFASNSGGN